MGTMTQLQPQTPEESQTDSNSLKKPEKLNQVGSTGTTDSTCTTSTFASTNSSKYKQNQSGKLLIAEEHYQTEDDYLDDDEYDTNENDSNDDCLLLDAPQSGTSQSTIQSNVSGSNSKISAVSRNSTNSKSSSTAENNDDGEDGDNEEEGHDKPKTAKKSVSSFGNKLRGMIDINNKEGKRKRKKKQRQKTRQGEHVLPQVIDTISENSSNHDSTQTKSNSTFDSSKSNMDSTNSQKEEYTRKQKQKQKSRTIELLDEFKCLMNDEFPSSDPKNTTLHIACLKHYSDSLVIDHLLKQGPDAVSKVNSNYDLPLHCVVMNGVSNSRSNGISDKVVDSLLELHPMGIHHTNAYGCLPIHIACHQSEPSIYALQRLLDGNPNSLMVKCKLELPFDPRARDYIRPIVHYEEIDEQGIDPGIRSKNVTADRSSTDTDPYYDNDEDSNHNCFWNVVSSLSPTNRNSFESSKDFVHSSIRTLRWNNSDTSSDVETDFTPLHLAVLSGAPPDVIELLLNARPECITLETSQKRTAFDCAKYAVIHQLSSIDDSVVSKTTKNIFAAIEILQTFERIQKKKNRLNSFISQRSSLLDRSLKSTSTERRQHPASTILVDNNVDFNDDDSFAPQKIAVAFSKRLLNSLSFTSPFGVPVDLDQEDVQIPDNFTVPPKLAHSCVDLELPVGFRQLRRAMLNRRSTFVTNELMKKKLNYSA